MTMAIILDVSPLRAKISGDEGFRLEGDDCWGKAASFPLVASEVILHLRNLRRLKRRRISFDGKC